MDDDRFDDAVLVLDDVHVTYRIHERVHSSLKESIARFGRGRKIREIHAVRGVSLTLRPGDALGVIGSNGSGKSTLMQAMAGALPATRGVVYARNRPMLLGVGAALKPGFTGRENIFVGCLALGMTVKETRALAPQIIEFAGLEDFIDMPMGTYSSGMRARLHFSIATARTPDVLLIDEALAVGDGEFKGRSNERIAEIRRDAGTVVLVSHNLREVRRTCDQTLWLDRGVVRGLGPTADVLALYKHSIGLDPIDNPDEVAARLVVGAASSTEAAGAPDEPGQ